MNTTEARDEIFGMFRLNWGNLAGAVVGGDPPPIIWQGQEQLAPQIVNGAYARAVVLHQSGMQASLAGDTGIKMWRRSGVVIVQCFGPLSSGKGLTIAEGLATIVKNSFEGLASPGGIWFRNVRINEVGPNDAWYQVNTIADFTYDEVR